MDILDSMKRHPRLLPSILAVLNQVCQRRPCNKHSWICSQMIDNEDKIQENLCLVGMLPSIVRYCGLKYPREIRVEAARFVHHICAVGSSNPDHTITLQMFIASRLEINKKTHLAQSNNLGGCRSWWTC